MTFSEVQLKVWTEVQAFYVFLKRNPRQVGAFLMYVLGILLSLLSLVNATSSGAATDFLVLNERIHDVYWQSLLLLLTILIPVSIETFKFLEVRFQKLGKSLYLYEVVKVDRFYTLVPLFAFTFIFSLMGSSSNGQYAINSEVLIFFHTFLFFLWIMMFWYIFELLVLSIRLLADSGSDVYVKAIEHLKNGDAQLSEEGNIENWRIAWNSFSLVRNEWREKILSVFWIKLNKQSFQEKTYSLANNLTADFAQNFLDIEGQKHNPKDVKWLNERMRWLWFHKKNFSDDKENPYSVYVRMLELYAELRKRREIAFSKETQFVFESGLDQLYRTVKDIVEKLTRSELEESFDGYFGFFKILREHSVPYAESPDDSDKEYLASIPVYYPIFDHADKLASQGSTFPKEWQLSAENLDELFKKQGDGRLRLIWLNHFLNWSGQRIDHGKKGFDTALDGSIEILFPKMHNPWFALWLGYRNLSWGSDRIDSLCKWDRNFGFGSYIGESYWYDQNKSEEENEQEMFAQDNALRVESKRNTARILLKLQAFGTISDIGTLRTTLISLEGRYQDEQSAELNRLELLELTRLMLEVEHES